MNFSSVRHRLPQSPTAIQDEFEKRGWSDGLPIIPPTEALVREMLAGTPLPPQHEVARLEPTHRIATVEKIAINAVMAGCRPVHLPVVIAAINAVSDPAFCQLPMGTNPATPLAVVSGPARQLLQINCSYNTLGTGTGANLKIGRAIRLVIQNVGLGGALSVHDQTTIGMPGKLGMCIGENEEASPWEPLHVERGWGRESNTVTVFNVTGTLNIVDMESKDAVALLTTIGRSMVAHGINNFIYPTMPLVILGPEHASLLAAASYSKADVKAALWKFARIPEDEFSPGLRDYLNNRSARSVKAIDGYVHVTEAAEGIAVIVAGGLGPHSAFLPTLGFNRNDAQTREILLPK